MEHSTHSLLTLGIALMAGVLGQTLGRHLRFPAIVLLLAFGALLGPEVLGWVQPRSLGPGLFGLVEIGIAIILFEGGLNLQSSRLRRQERTIRYLLTIGAGVTLCGAAVAAHYFLDWPWYLSFLFGSLVVVTGPTVVTPLLRDMRLHPRVKTVLEAEGVLIDPIGAVLAALVLQVVLAPSAADTLAKELVFVLYRVGFGVAAGVLGGLLVGGMLKVKHLVPHGLENIFALSGVLLLFTGCEAVIATSGIMAVTVAGVVVGWVNTRVDRELREFKDQITLLLVGLLFILLAADIRLEEITSLGSRAVWVMAALVLVVRPLAVFASTFHSPLNMRERTFMSAVAPRGIVAAAIASLTVDTLAHRGMEGGEGLRGLVFLTIACTVVLAGVTARPLASLLKVRLPGRNRVAILGADGLGVLLGEELSKNNVPVVFLDSDPQRCRDLENKGHTVVFGDALEERTLLRAQFELVGTAVAVTANDHLNSMFVGNAREYFKVPQGLVALGAMAGGELPAHVKRHEAEILFDGPHDVERWDVRLRHDDLVMMKFVYRPPAPAKKAGEAAPKPGDAEPVRQVSQENFVIVAVKRGEKMMPMWKDLKLKPGDVASVAVYRPEIEEAVRALAKQHWMLEPDPNSGQQSEEGEVEKAGRPASSAPRRSTPSEPRP